MKNNMNWIKGCVFKIKGIEYVVTSVWYKNLKTPVVVEFKTNSRDEEVKHFKMSYTDFNKKVKTENYLKQI